MKTVLFVATTQGAGTQLINEVLVNLGLVRINDDPALFWPLYIKAQSEPDFLCTWHDLAKDGYTNRDAFSDLCARWDVVATATELLTDPEKAHQAFREIIVDRIDAPNLMISHLFHYVQPFVEVREGLEPYRWSQAECDRAFDLLVESLTHPSIELKALRFLRHPMAVYASKRERFEDELTHDERLKHLEGYYRRLTALDRWPAERRYTVRYEDLCAEPASVVPALAAWVLPDANGVAGVASIQAALAIPLARSVQHASLESRLGADRVNEITEALGYRMRDVQGRLNWMADRAARYRYEFAIVAGVAFGRRELSVSSVHHAFSLPSKVLRRLTRLIPGVSARWDEAGARKAAFNRAAHTRTPDDPGAA
ncbi:MAG: hypothetical protein IIC95_07715 [Chloroflexi bacterium]|nr:hypothetical protein [Chloroflexota bacterium]